MRLKLHVLTHNTPSVAAKEASVADHTSNLRSRINFDSWDYSRPKSNHPLSVWITSHLKCLTFKSQHPPPIFQLPTDSVCWEAQAATKASTLTVLLQPKLLKQASKHILLRTTQDYSVCSHKSLTLRATCCRFTSILTQTSRSKHSGVS